MPFLIKKVNKNNNKCLLIDKIVKVPSDNKCKAIIKINHKYQALHNQIILIYHSSSNKINFNRYRILKKILL